MLNTRDKGVTWLNGMDSDVFSLDERLSMGLGNTRSQAILVGLLAELGLSILRLSWVARLMMEVNRMVPKLTLWDMEYLDLEFRFSGGLKQKAPFIILKWSIRFLQATAQVSLSITWNSPFLWVQCCPSRGDALTNKRLTLLNHS